MIQSRTIARELALLILGQMPEIESKSLSSTKLNDLLNNALESLISNWREGLDSCANLLQEVNEDLLQNELQEENKESLSTVRDNLKDCLYKSENLLNELSISIDFPRLMTLSQNQDIRFDATNRVDLALKKLSKIDSSLDNVMEGWRLKRLPRIDRDILRLAVVDLMSLNTPPAVACNEAVELANRYSDEQGRRMINGVLRRLQNVDSTSII